MALEKLYKVIGEWGLNIEDMSPTTLSYLQQDIESALDNKEEKDSYNELQNVIDSLEELESDVGCMIEAVREIQNKED